MSSFNFSGNNFSFKMEVAEDEPRDENLAKIEIALLSIIFVSAAILNTGLLFVLWKRRSQVSRMRVFVFHLCVADLVVAFFQVCPQLVWDITDRFMGPDIMCRLVKYLQAVGMFASTYMIVVMTIDRYQAICHPMFTFRRRRARCNIPVCMAWVISLIGGLPQLFIFSMVQVAPGVFDCWAHFIQPWGLKTYVTWTTLVIFVVPIFTIVVCQVRICRAVQINLYIKTRQEGKNGVVHSLPSRASSVVGVSKARIKTVKMTVVIVLAYILCWAPFFTVQLWSVWDQNAPTETATFTLLMLLASLNSCANPCIYLIFSGQLPNNLMALLCRDSLDPKDSMLEEAKDSMLEEATMVSTLYLSFRNPPDSR